VRRLSYCFFLLSFLFLFACATDSGVDGDNAATADPSISQSKYPAPGAGITADSEDDDATTNSNINAIQQQQMQQQMMQQMQQKMMNSSGMGGGSFGGGGNPMGGGMPR
jgi:hypothetical protein